MEDAVTRTHAQQLVAAALYIGSRVVGDLMRRVLAHPNRVELRADGIAHTPENANRLQSLAARASRQALGEPPTAVVAAPDPRGGWRIHLAFAEQRPALRPFELTDLQQAWERVQQRAFGPAQARPTTETVLARQQDADRALDHLRRAQARLFATPSPETHEAFAAALNRAQVASDALRTALREADPVRFDRPLHHDRLDLLVGLQGDERLTLVERDDAVRSLLARAAALPDTSDLSVALRPTPQRDVWRAHVAFNFRNTLERGPQHLNPASLEATVLSAAPGVPALAVSSAAGMARVSVAGIEVVREIAHAPRERPVALDLPAAMQSRTSDSPEVRP